MTAHIFNFLKTPLEGLIIVEPFVSKDERGYYIKSYERDIFELNGIKVGVQEVCGSLSYRGVLRGLHYQTKKPQSKLVRCAFGQLFDVAVDLRKNSNTYGEWFGIELSHENNMLMYIPPGFAHGTLAISEVAILSYHSGERYLNDFDAGIRWDDPTISVKWPLNKISMPQPLLSMKDKALPYLSDCNIELDG